jgi:hypothetical protein
MIARAVEPGGEKAIGSRVRRAFRWVLVALVFAVPWSAAPAAGAQSFTVSTQPALYPAFDEAVPDYVTRCTTAPVDVDVAAEQGTEVDVDGHGPRAGTFTTSVSLKEGQAFEIVATSGASSATYYVRCLPADFPTWTFQRSALPEVEWFTAAPGTGSPPPGVSPNYVAFFDTNGVPVWWTKAAERPFDFHLLTNGNVIWTQFAPSSEEHRLDGSLVRVLTAVGASINSDLHEALLLPNGNHLLIVGRVVPGFSFCGGSNRRIFDYGYQEITPGGSVVRQWFASDHIPMSEVPAAWCDTINGTTGDIYDVYHANSVEPAGNDVVLSFRHLDAVYRVSGADGSIVWKLGGTARPESLTILNDPEFGPGGGGFGGQHDARVLGDGTVTVHDNGFHAGTGPRHPPRAVRYAIDTGAGTATLIEQVTDPAGLGSAGCCGSARRLPGGDWLASWGNDNLITELTSAGARVFSLSFQSGFFSYRSHPVLPGTLSRAALREGMDAQSPRPYPRPKSAAALRLPLVPGARECLAPNRMHGEPLAFGSCAPPLGTSGYLTVGTPDANGAAANSSGFVRYRVLAGDPATPESEADVTVKVVLTDVRRKSDLEDYTGQLQVHAAVQITDRPGGATGLDTDLPATVRCNATASSTIGASCQLSSSFNAIVPGAVSEGHRANWELGEVQVFDGGASGVAGASDAGLFARPGIFIP